MNHPLYPIFWAADAILGVIIVVIIIDVVMSWLLAFGVVNLRNQLVYSINMITDRILSPLLRPIRRLLPSVSGLDFAPLALLLIIYVLRMYLWQLFAWIVT